jgi:hypothetical protein
VIKRFSNRRVETKGRSIVTNVVPMEAEISRERRAERIRKLMADMAHNTLAIGGELERAQETFEIGPNGQRMGWRSWLKTEFKLGLNWANSLIRAHRKFGHLIGSADRLPSASVLIFLGREATPKAATQEVLKRTAKGETVGRIGSQEIVKKHLPSPKKANAIAKQTGTPTAASDGYVYLGASDADVKQSAQRRTVVYAVREAVETIAKVQVSAEDFLEYALPHQLWKAKNEHQIKQAADWLGALSHAWAKRR